MCESNNCDQDGPSLEELLARPDVAEAVAEQIAAGGEAMLHALEAENRQLRAGAALIKAKLPGWLLSVFFREQCEAAPDEAALAALIEDRQQLARVAMEKPAKPLNGHSGHHANGHNGHAPNGFNGRFLN